MEVLKIALVIAAGLGSTLAAKQVTDALFGAPVVQLVQAQEEAPQSPGGGAAGAEIPSPVQDMSREEMEAELKRAQRELAGKAEDDMREFRPSKPLPADLPIALPSNI
jgi:hypothetical protein